LPIAEEVSLASVDAALSNKLFYKVFAEATIGSVLAGSEARSRILSFGKL